MDQVAQIREKIDIVSLISETVTLKKTGRNFHGLCPFHSEKTPSFVVSPERQIWHCFGCQKGGDVYTFLMEYENIDFLESLRILAKKAGIELIQEKYDKATSSQKDKLFTLNHLASEYYHYVLTKHPVGRKALEYLSEKRFLTPALINTFMLGFSPPAGTGLVSYLFTKKKYSKEDILASGLGIEIRSRFIDFFRGRLMFPLYDSRGNIVGFSGRSLADSLTNGPKYINTRETLIYQKGSHFFGLNSAKDEIRKEDKAIIVEGEFDVISCFKEGIKNVVASKGTALTSQQIQLLSRFTQKISLCLDKDNAGQEAMFRSLSILEQKGITTTVVVITTGKDPDEAIQKDPYAFKKALKHDIPIYDFILGRAAGLYDKNTAEGKKQISGMILPIYARIENQIVKEHYLKKLSIELNTTFESVSREIDRVMGKPTLKDKIQQATKVKRGRTEVLEEYLFALILQYPRPEQAVEKITPIISLVTFNTPAYQRILEHFISYFQKNANYDSKVFSASLPEELTNLYNRCYLLPLPVFEDEKKQLKEIVRVAKVLKITYIHDKIKYLGEKIQEKENEESEEKEMFKKELSNLILLLRQEEE